MTNARQLAGRGIELVLQFRFTLVFIAVMVLANAAAGTLAGELPEEMLRVWGIGQKSVWSGDLARLLTGTFLSHDVDMFFRQIVFAMLAVGYTELKWGSLKAAVAFFALDIGSTLVLLTTVWLNPALSDVTALNDVGMSMGGFGLIGLAAAGMRHRWVLFAVVLLSVAAKIAVDAEPLTDTGHVIALSLGFVAGLWMYWKKDGGRPA